MISGIVLNVLIFIVGVHVSALQHCRKIKFSIYLNKTLIYTNCEVLCLSDFVAGRKSQLQNTVER